MTPVDPNTNPWYKCDECDEWFSGKHSYAAHRSNCVHASDEEDSPFTFDRRSDSLEEVVETYFHEDEDDDDESKFTFRE